MTPLARAAAVAAATAAISFGVAGPALAANKPIPDPYNFCQPGIDDDGTVVCSSGNTTTHLVPIPGPASGYVVSDRSQSSFTTTLPGGTLPDGTVTDFTGRERHFEAAPRGGNNDAVTSYIGSSTMTIAGYGTCTTKYVTVRAHDAIRVDRTKTDCPAFASE